MYCKECGSPLKKGDRVCKICGTSIDLVDENVEDKSTDDSTSKKDDFSEFQWNVYDFPKPRKTDDLDLDWGFDDNRKKNSSLEKDELDIDFSSVEKFFTFHKKNEEFQKLLDKEYERIKRNEARQEEILHRPTFSLEDRKEELEEDQTVIEEELVAEEVEEEIEETTLVEDEDIEEEKEEELVKVEEEDEEKVPLISDLEKDVVEDVPVKEETEEKDLFLFDIEHVEEKKKKGGFKRAVLIIVVIILIAEVLALGITYFAPDTSAGKKVAEIQAAIGGVFSNIKDEVTAFFNKDECEMTSTDPIEEPEEEEEPEEVEEPLDPKPSEDKDALIESQLFNNKNIKNVRANDQLKYQDGKDYGVEDINKSKPIENNIWMTTENGETLYYDQEIVATLISFDSQWVDYVQGESDQVLGLVEEGSQAYKNVSTFSKVGKVRQEFLTLEIGELRQGNNGFYAWTYEKIKEYEGNKVNEKEYYWIYHLKPVDRKMKIANYHKYSLK
ncbi:MAG: hypothetical protein GX076_03135 [Clostridiales bacterium]|nr:hypothetical protein [Clostridiales bacterium]